MASRLFTVDLDLGLNKAKRFIFEDFSSAPTGTTGRVIYWTAGDSAANHLKVYNGSAWKTLAYTDDVADVSISLDAATGFNVTGSPAGASGTLTFEWDTVAANSVLAGAVSGSNAIPTFRALVDADIPAEIARVDDIPVSGTDFIPYTEKGEPLGVAELNASGVVPAEQLDLGNYVTLDGSQTITGLKYFTGGLHTENILALWSNNNTGTPSANGYGSIYIDDTSENLILSAGEGMSSSIGGDIVVLGTGQYLDSVATNNQIATIGDLSGFISEETDPVFSASAAFGITTTSIANWDTAYGWGDHSTEGYLTSESDPVFSASAAFGITTTNISNWNTAYGWGDHGAEGYLTVAVEAISNTDGNITFSASTGSVTADLATDIEISGDLIVQGDLTVNGDVTTLNTATMNIEDNIFVLNSNVTGTPSVNAGLEVERGTYTNASIFWNETDNAWSVATPDDSTDDANNFYIARKWAKGLTGSATSYTLNHNLGTRDVTVQVYETASPYAQVETATEYTTVDSVTIYFNTAPADGAYRAVVTG